MFITKQAKWTPKDNHSAELIEKHWGENAEEHARERKQYADETAERFSRAKALAKRDALEMLDEATRGSWSDLCVAIEVAQNAGCSYKSITDTQRKGHITAARKIQGRPPMVFATRVD